MLKRPLVKFALYSIKYRENTLLTSSPYPDTSQHSEPLWTCTSSFINKPAFLNVVSLVCCKKTACKKKKTPRDKCFQFDLNLIPCNMERCTFSDACLLPFTKWKIYFLHTLFSFNSNPFLVRWNKSRSRDTNSFVWDRLWTACPLKRHHADTVFFYFNQLSASCKMKILF